MDRSTVGGMLAVFVAFVSVVLLLFLTTTWQRRNPWCAAGEENFWTLITGEHEQACKHPPNGAAGATRNTCLFVQEGVDEERYGKGTY